MKFMEPNVGYTMSQYIDKLSHIKKLNKIAIGITQLAGTWWLFFYGMILFIELGTFNLLIWGGISLLLLYMVIYVAGDHPISKPIWIVRLTGLLGFYYMIDFTSSILLSVLIYASAVMFHSDISILMKRLQRTQSFSSTIKYETSLITIVEESMVYIDDRLNWIYVNHGFSIVIGLLFMSLIYIINPLINENNAIIFQVVSALMIILLIVYFIPNLYPKIIRKKKHDEQ